MKQFYLYFLTVFVTSTATSVFCQSAIGSSSNTVIVNDQIHEYSVGEMCAISTISSVGLIVTQGFLQPLPSTSTTDEAKFIFANVKIMPNPTQDQIVITGILPENVDNLSIQLLDTKSSLIETNQVNISGDFEHVIDLARLPSGTYYLKIQTAKSIKISSIIKL